MKPTNSKNLSLRAVLIFPYVALVVSLAVAIGALSYKTGHQAVLTVSEHLLKETASRISQAVDRHIVGSVATLEAAFPKGMTAPASIEPEADALRTRFWTATTLHIDPNNYVYYGNLAGQAFGLYRHSYNRGELRIKFQPEEHRKRYRIDGIFGEPQFDFTEAKLFDPRTRPWFQAAQSSNKDIWTSVYIDFGTRELVATRARRVLGEDGTFQGVVATDMSLQALNTFVRNLEISPNGLAFIIEPNGDLIASSFSPNVRAVSDGQRVRINAARSGHPLLEEIYPHLRTYLEAQAQQLEPQTFYFTDNHGEKTHVGVDLFEDKAGLKWFNVVAIPEKDFIGGIRKNVYGTLIIGILATVLVVWIGLWILNWVTGDIKLLSEAVNTVDSGLIEQPINIRRKDEIGDLANSFRAMQYRLQTDHLTGLPNRYAFEQYLSAILEDKNGSPPTPFAVLFVDINDFKLINDQHGHDTGDKALIEIALRLRTSIRQNDLVARYAGDEFVIILNNVKDKAALQEIKTNIENSLREPLQTLNLSTTHAAGAVGDAHFPDDADNAKDLVNIADQRMYSRKAAMKAEPC